MTIFLDLDGVLADFDAGLRNYGVDRNDTTFIHRHKSTWTQDQVYLDKIVRSAMGQPGFWEAIPVMPDAIRLWNYCKPYNPVILTAVPSVPEWHKRVEQEKRSWIKRVIGTLADEQIVCCLRSEKIKYMSDPNLEYQILVDDMQANIDDWNKAGGIGILHKSAEESVKRLDHIINGAYAVA